MTTSPQTRRPGEFEVQYSEEVLMEALRKVSWFHDLKESDLRLLARRGRLEGCGRYKTIIREGGRGKYFYILLSGYVHVTSIVKKGLSVRLGPGTCFGEAALVTTVQREATITALEPCKLMLLAAEDIDGLSTTVDLSTVRWHVISLILETVYFFRDLTKQQHDDLSRCMELLYYEKGSVIFEEDDWGDAMYVLIEGCTEMRKRSADDKLIATFTPSGERPWFGETALLSPSRTKRSCAAVCTENSKLLIVRTADFPRFIEIAPSFNEMFMQQKEAYSKLEAMRQQSTSSDDVVKTALLTLGSSAHTLAKADEDPMKATRRRSSVTEAAAHQAKTLQRWASLTSALLAKWRLNQATEEDLLDEMEEQATLARAPGSARVAMGAPSPARPRRVSYVAGRSAAPELPSEGAE